jgi:hypothetical protein
MMEAQRITLAMIDRSAGFEAQPERVRLADLARFADDVQVFLRGSGREVDTQQLDVAVRNGSLAIETEPLAAAPRLIHDLQSLLLGELLDGLDSKRKEVMERWQKSARASRDLAYRITAPFLQRPVVISAQSDYRADDADQWVQVERYVRGELQNLGGSIKANAHVRLPDGSLLTVATEKALLRDDTVNRLYKTAMLRITAEFNVVTRELRHARLLEFVTYAPKVDEEELDRLGRRGTAAWKDVPDATAWVDELRGGSR